MASTRELRRRIRSIRNTAQITKAMQMVAVTKMRRAQTQALSGRPYSNVLIESLRRLLPKVNKEENPLLNQGPGSISVVTLLSTDKGLCGALNTNLFRAVLNYKDFSNPSFYAVGRKGESFAVKMGKKLVAFFENPDRVAFATARQIGKALIESFLKGELKEAYIAYPQFVSTLRQEPKILKLLPISFEGLALEEPIKESSAANEFLFEPSPALLLDEVLNHFVEVRIYQAMLETKASEFSAKMIAMQNATDNALELVDDYTLTYNQTRQDNITKELLEITTAALALE